MASTLTWYQSTGPTQTAATLAGFFADFDTMVTANASNANFSWEVGQYQSSNPYYITLVQKNNLPSGGNPAPVILIVGYTGAPAGNNPHIFDTTPATNAIQICYFPSATTSTPSNLSASSGTIMGSDTNCVKAATSSVAAATFYAAGTQLFYFDSADAIWFFSQTPGGSQQIMAGSGLIAVDYLGNAYAGNYSNCASSTQIWSNGPAYVATQITNAGATSFNGLRTNYGAANSLFYLENTNLAQWENVNSGSTGEYLRDSVNSIVYFYARPLLSGTLGQGATLKLRQVGGGPASLGSFGTAGSLSIAFYSFNGSGNVPMAILGSNVKSSTVDLIWFTNFQI